MKEPVRLGVNGAAGRMGCSLIRAIAQSDDLILGAALVRPGSPRVGSDAGEFAGVGTLGVPLSQTLKDSSAQIDVMIDFSTPQAALAMASESSKAGHALIIGTTGFSEKEQTQLRKLAGRVPVVLAPNMSVGVNVTIQLLEMAAQALGEETDIEIIEAHHKNKADAPSGTALYMGERIARSQGRALADCAVYAREGHTGPRKPGSIGFESIRAGDIVGEHTVLFALPGERLEITHRANSRDNFTAGALRASRWIVGRKPGLYAMRDVLGLG